jgi:hypothetical protein
VDPKGVFSFDDADHEVERINYTNKLVSDKTKGDSKPSSKLFFANVSNHISKQIKPSESKQDVHKSKLVIARDSVAYKGGAISGALSPVLSSTQRLNDLVKIKNGAATP